jgi:DNA repair exonuclease SbcCD ATPase subunit
VAGLRQHPERDRLERAAIAEYKSLHSAVTELGKKRTELDAKVEDLTLEKETLVDQIKAARTTLNRLEESVEKLRTASTTLAGAIKKAGSDAGTSMQGIVKQAKSAIAEARRKAETGLEKSGGSLDRTIMESMERLSKAAAKAEKQADKVRRDMELVARKSVDVGRVLERMEPIGRVYHFISSGKGEPNDVYKWSIDFMEQLEKWELSRAPSARTYSLRDAIKETRGNWSRSLEM